MLNRDEKCKWKKGGIDRKGKRIKIFRESRRKGHA